MVRVLSNNYTRMKKMKDLTHKVEDLLHSNKNQNNLLPFVMSENRRCHNKIFYKL